MKLSQLNMELEHASKLGNNMFVIPTTKLFTDLWTKKKGYIGY